MQSTKVELGETKNHFIVKRKAKNKPELTGYCNSPTCLTTVQLDEKHRCLNCFNQVVRPFTYDATKKRFDNFLEKNLKLIDGFLFVAPENEDLKIPIIFNKRTVYVPLRYFIEYQNLSTTEEYKDNKHIAYQTFFDYIKMTCDDEKF